MDAKKMRAGETGKLVAEEGAGPEVTRMVAPAPEGAKPAGVVGVRLNPERSRGPETVRFAGKADGGGTLIVTGPGVRVISAAEWERVKDRLDLDGRPYLVPAE